MHSVQQISTKFFFLFFFILECFEDHIFNAILSQEYVHQQNPYWCSCMMV